MTGFSVQDCEDACPVTDTFRGISYAPDRYLCACHYDDGTLPSGLSAVPDGFVDKSGNGGSGPVVPVIIGGDYVSSNCYKYHPAQ